MWKQPVGAVHSSFVAADGLAFTIEQRGGEEVAAAYDLRTGREAWTHSWPAVRLAGVEQILVFTASRLVALSADGAHELWQVPWPTHAGINVAQPLVLGDDRVFVSSGYGTGAALIEIVREGEHLDAREVWRTSRMKNQFTSSVHHGGFI